MTHDLLVAARRLGTDLLAPGAAAVDDHGVRRRDLDALGAAGLLGATLAPAATFRAVQEVLAAADASTWFVQVQHHHPVRMLLERVAAGDASPALRAAREDLLAGRRVAGVAFSHLRRWPARPVEATRVEGGWRYDGTVPWFTGWGLNDVLALGGTTADGEVVFTLVDAVAGPHLRPTPPLRLAALGAAGTVQLHLDALVVPDDLVLARTDVDTWRSGDERTTVSTNPAVLGIATAAAERLALLGGRRSLPDAVELAQLLLGRLADVRSAAYGLADAGVLDADEALAVRARAQRLCLDATTALVTAGAGGSMSLDDPAQRWAREALFLVVQGQTLPARRTMLRSWLTP